jgi:SAM-dependent methyltransferase
VELDPAMAAIAGDRLDRVVVADLEDAGIVSRLGDTPFDGMIAGDILEHLVDPWRTLRILAGVLGPDAVIVASLPNVGFWDTWWNTMIRKRWPYRPRGIHDTTHLRFFARRNLEPLFSQAGYRVERIDRSYRLIERPHPRNRFARFVAIPGARDLLTFQFIVTARRVASVVVAVDRPVGDHDELIAPG